MRLLPRSLVSRSAQLLCSFLSAKSVYSLLLSTHESTIPPLRVPLNYNGNIKNKLGLQSPFQNIQETVQRSLGEMSPLDPNIREEVGKLV